MIRRGKEEAELANRAKSEFLANVSHELRTPLNAIIGFSQILHGETLGPIANAQYQEYAADIHSAGEQLLDLINDILDLSKIESGAVELHEEEVEVPELVNSVLRLVTPRAEKGSVDLELDIPSDLPLLYADERKLRQIVINLLSNAIKFTGTGGRVTVRISSPVAGGFIFQIADTGIGIAPSDIPKALSQFGQIDGKLARRYEGTGLGLPLTKALVEQHGGSLELQSDVGVGTTVTVRFPAGRIVASLDNSDSPDVGVRAAS